MKLLELPHPRFIITSLIFFSTILLVHAQDTSLIKYLPLDVGNVWVYRGYSATVQCHSSEWYDRYELTGTTQINGKTYFEYNHTLVYVSGQCSWSSTLFGGNGPIRVDSLSLNIYKYTNCGSSQVSLLDSLKAGLNDTSWMCPQGYSILCSDTSSYSICGRIRPSKTFRFPAVGWDYAEIQRYVKDIGLVWYYYYCGGTYQISLQGCVINGVVCGDTTMTVGIQIINSRIPQKYLLYQNYPNPFNPMTNIRFDLAKPSFVQLIVYDVLGKEVEKLVNQELKAGTYSVDWNSSDFTSGIYFYQIRAGDYFKTRRMAFLK